MTAESDPTRPFHPALRVPEAEPCPGHVSEANGGEMVFGLGRNRRDELDGANRDDVIHGFCGGATVTLF